jgi:hypothetical protein
MIDKLMPTVHALECNDGIERICDKFQTLQMRVIPGTQPTYLDRGIEVSYKDGEMFVEFHCLAV